MDPIKYIFEKPALTQRISRWQMLLSEYDNEYRAQKAVKGSVLAEYLAHQPIEDYQSVRMDLPNEDVMYLRARDSDVPLLEEGPEPGSRWGLVSYGASNVHGHRVGAVIITPQAEFNHIPRDENHMVDASATLSSMYKVNFHNDEPRITIRRIDRHAHVFAVGEWVEAASYANVTRQVVVKFIKNNIICRYGGPSKIITDNGSNLNNRMMRELCESFKIEHHNNSPYRPEMNGAVEAANKNIKKIVQKMVFTYKDWH
ncbi:uncharacterized protein LOC131631653 [Vicia villosa]|uniref:uncharacterized protein LOC131631653 n=1 Tax=Vicia villosa TaxID=3911 RepID=UPI00273AE920|nr:uncharacterized protein LOC131631653 [Vicia villosa]